jgi:hypothetical protein
MTATDSNVQMSHDEGVENSFRVCSVVANIAAVLVDLQVRKFKDVVCVCVIEQGLFVLDIFESAREGL